MAGEFKKLEYQGELGLFSVQKGLQVSVRGLLGGARRLGSVMTAPNTMGSLEWFTIANCLAWE